VNRALASDRHRWLVSVAVAVVAAIGLGIAVPKQRR